MKHSNPKISLHRARGETVERQLKIRGLRTSWLEAGSPSSREILLLLHGFPDDAHVWDAQIAHFRDRYLILAPMLRGVGGSEAPRDESRYGLSAVSLDLLAILKHADPEDKKKIHLVGHDLGSLYAWHLAPLIATRLKSLVIVNGGHPLTVWERRTNWRQLVKSWYIALFLLPYLPEALLKLRGKTWLARTKMANGMPSYKALDALDSCADAVKQYRAIAGSMPDYWWRRDRFRLDAPVLALSSLNDAFIEPATLEEMRLIAKHPTVRHLEGRHWVQVESPERVNRLMDKFFTEAKAA